MIILKTPEEVEIMAAANQIVAEVLLHLKERVTPGVTTNDLNRMADELIRKKGGIPTFIGYRGFPKALCTSINEEVVHGIPSQRELKEGDIIGLDLGVTYKGFVGDSAITVAIGSISNEARQLMKITEESLSLAIDKVREGMRIGDISYCIQSYAETHGYTVVKDFVGHGIGRQMHEDPQVPNYGDQGKGPRIKVGMVVAIEPMLNRGGFEVEVLKDKWTVVTKDRQLSAHFEHSVACTPEGPRVLSRL